MLAYQNDGFEGKNVVISGSGNVAQFAAEKCIQLGGKVKTLSDSSGYIVDPDGIDEEKLAFIMDLKNVQRGRIHEYTEQYPNASFHAGKRPWEIPCEVALPCATQNELNGKDAELLIKNGCKCVGEGANMPSTPEAISLFVKNNVLFAPGKASNAGGVAVSGLEMAQNSLRYSWTRDEVDQRLKAIMKDIHQSCIQYGTEKEQVNYVKGANIAGFVKIADAMLAQGVV
jgi:glutamate dehydrogenase (NADP+)